MPNRDIHDNILVGHEIPSLCSKISSKKDYMTIKLDMKKAYDRVDWDFIRKCFTCLDFCDKWTNWVMQCTTTITFEVVMNRQTTSLIYPKQGIRQSDPISSYSFIICTEYLWLLSLFCLYSGQIRNRYKIT